MRDYEEVKRQIEELKERRKGLTLDERKVLSKEITRLKTIIISHERYKPVENKGINTFAMTHFGKNYKDLNAEELREYNRLKQRISRQK